MTPIACHAEVRSDAGSQLLLHTNHKDSSLPTVAQRDIWMDVGVVLAQQGKINHD